MAQMRVDCRTAGLAGRYPGVLADVCSGSFIDNRNPAVDSHPS